MSTEEIRGYTQKVWDSFYEIGAIWQRANCVKSMKARLAFVLISMTFMKKAERTTSDEGGGRLW